MLAAKSGWNEPVLQRAFRRRLSDAVRDAVIWGARPRDLDELIDRAVDIDNYQGERRREQASRHAPPRSPSRCCPSPLRSPARIRRPLSASARQEAHEVGACPAVRYGTKQTPLLGVLPLLWAGGAPIVFLS